MLLEDDEPVLEAEFTGLQTITVKCSMRDGPVLKLREVAAILKKFGFAEVRQRGSHEQFRHADGRRTRSPFMGRATSRPDTFKREYAR